MLDALKQMQAFVAGALPFLTMKFEIFPFINPQVGSDLWEISALSALAASATTYNLATPNQSPLLARTLALVGFLLAIIMSTMIILVGSELVFRESPRWQDGSIRLGFFFFFLSIGFLLGWIGHSLIGKKGTDE